MSRVSLNQSEQQPKNSEFLNKTTKSNLEENVDFFLEENTTTHYDIDDQDAKIINKSTPNRPPYDPKSTRMGTEIGP